MEALAPLVLPNLVILVAAALQTAAGVGFAMVAVPLLGLVDMGWLPAPLLQANLVLSLVMAARGRTALEPAEAPPLVMGLALGTLLGVWVLSLLSESALRLAIGATLCLAVVLSLASPPVPLTRRSIFAGSTLGGTTGVIAAMHGPPLILLYQREHPEKVRATMGVVFVLGCVMALGTLWLAGLYGGAEVRAGLALLPGVACGYLAGRWIAGRLPHGVARGTMLTIAALGGLALIARAF